MVTLTAEQKLEVTEMSNTSEFMLTDLQKGIVPFPSGAKVVKNSHFSNNNAMTSISKEAFLGMVE
jgi:hypothetical protein